MFASHHSHHVQTIPVENYETELQVLGEHVEIPETPVRVVKNHENCSCQGTSAISSESDRKSTLPCTY